MGFKRGSTTSHRDRSASAVSARSKSSGGARGGRGGKSAPKTRAHKKVDESRGDPYAVQSSSERGYSTRDPYSRDPSDPYSRDPSNPYSRDPSDPYSRDPSNPYSRDPYSRDVSDDRDRGQGHSEPQERRYGHGEKWERDSSRTNFHDRDPYRSEDAHLEESRQPRWNEERASAGYSDPCARPHARPRQGTRSRYPEARQAERYYYGDVDDGRHSDSYRESHKQEQRRSDAYANDQLSHSSYQDSGSQRRYADACERDAYERDAYDPYERRSYEPDPYTPTSAGHDAYRGDPYGKDAYGQQQLFDDDGDRRRALGVSPRREDSSARVSKAGGKQPAAEWERTPAELVPRSWRYQQQFSARGESAARLAYNYEKGRVYDSGADGHENELGETQEAVIVGTDPGFGRDDDDDAAGGVARPRVPLWRPPVPVPAIAGVPVIAAVPALAGVPAVAAAPVVAVAAAPVVAVAPVTTVAAVPYNTKQIVSRIIEGMRGVGGAKQSKRLEIRDGVKERKHPKRLEIQEIQDVAKGTSAASAVRDEEKGAMQGAMKGAIDERLEGCEGFVYDGGEAEQWSEEWNGNDGVSSVASNDRCSARSLHGSVGSKSASATTLATTPATAAANGDAASAHIATANRGRRTPSIVASHFTLDSTPDSTSDSTPPEMTTASPQPAPASPVRSPVRSPVPNGTPPRRARAFDDDSAASSISTPNAPLPDPQDTDPHDDRLGQGLSPDILDAVVKIYATHCDPNYSLPWQMRRQTQSTSSGFVISGRRILTNAHSVEHYTVVRVKKRAGDHKYIARVLATGNECDLALLTVEDDSFWDDVNPLPFGTLPELQASVIVVGYPIGGENISVTAGVVSRVEIQEYTHGASQLLGIQIDAAINSGSSGGPALNHRNEVVGIAFQSLNTGDSENIGYLVAESVVDHFLLDYANNGRYTGFCHCGFHWQKMENSALRRCMNMGPNDSGILVRKVMKTSPAQGVLKQGDIVTAIDDVQISNAGTVPYRSGERISFHYIITTKFTGDDISLDILRDGQKLSITYQLRNSSENLLVPVHEHRRQPEYFTIAGLVFVALSEPYLAAEYGDKWDLKAPVRLLERLLYGSKEHIEEQVVLLSQVLNAEINIEYECVINTRVNKFNGEKLRNLAHLAKRVETCTDDFLRFDLDDEIVVVAREEALQASAEILETHCIPSACSIGELPPLLDDGKAVGKTVAAKSKANDDVSSGNTSPEPKGKDEPPPDEEAGAQQTSPGKPDQTATVEKEDKSVAKTERDKVAADTSA